jgi:uncharacterized protein DUF6341
MISNNFFRALGDLFTNVLFAPYDALRFTDGWWITNTISVIFFVIAFSLYLYWLGQLQKFRKTINE